MNKAQVRYFVFVLIASVIGYNLVSRTSQVPPRNNAGISAHALSLQDRLYKELAVAEKNKNIPTILLLLKIIVDDAKERGEKAALDYNLCDAQLSHSSHLFCKLNKGIDRLRMPQLKGTPIAGSAADALPRDSRNEVDASQAFLDYLKNVKHYTVTLEDVPAMSLQATQNELIGSKVAGIWYALQDPTSTTYKELMSLPIFISEDNYILDGHHRWAAIVAHGINNGNLANVRMKAERVHVPIIQLVRDANEFANAFGIKAEAGL